MAAPHHKTTHDNVLHHSPIRSCEIGKQKRKGRAASSRGSLCPYPHEVVLRHGVRYPTHFVVGLEDVIVDLEFLSAVIPGRQDSTAALGGSQFNYQLVFAQPGLTNEMIMGANVSAVGCFGGSGCLRSDQRGLTPNCQNADSGRDLRDDDRCNFVGDNGLGLVVVDVDRLEGAHAKRLPAVGHSVDVDALERGRYRNGLWCGAGSCTHAPQAAVNDMAVGSKTGSKHSRTHADEGNVSGGGAARRRVWLFVRGTIENVLFLSQTTV